jgi:hypothetical protein
MVAAILMACVFVNVRRLPAGEFVILRGIVLMLVPALAAGLIALRLGFGLWLAPPRRGRAACLNGSVSRGLPHAGRMLHRPMRS